MDFSDSKLRLTTTTWSTTLAWVIWEKRESISWPLEEQLWNSMESGLAMLRGSSRKFVELIGRDLEVRLVLIQQNFDSTIDASIASSMNKVHEISWIYLQSCSMMIPDDELGNELWFDLKKFEEKLRESLREILRSENCDVLLWNSVRVLCYILPPNHALIKINQC